MARFLVLFRFGTLIWKHKFVDVRKSRQECLHLKYVRNQSSTQKVEVRKMQKVRTSLGFYRQYREDEQRGIKAEAVIRTVGTSPDLWCTREDLEL